MKAVIIAFAIFCLAALSGCLFTAIGLDHESLRNTIDFGAPETVKLCVYLDRGITADRARELLSSWDSEAPKYRLAVTPVSFQPLARDGFFHSSIVRQIESRTLAPDCDRNLYFVNRNVEDFVWGDLAAAAFPLPEILGEVEDATLTSGFVVATMISFNQLLLSPYAVTRHELYHLLGCKQHFDMPACYAQIAALKERERQLRASGFFRKIGEQPFYPTWDDLTDAMLTSRIAVSQKLAANQGPADSPP
jgi:hypothetical protein